MTRSTCLVMEHFHMRQRILIKFMLSVCTQNNVVPVLYSFLSLNSTKHYFQMWSEIKLLCVRLIKELNVKNVNADFEKSAHDACSTKAGTGK